MKPPRLTRLAQTRDLSVPDWGPYSKLMAGVSHLVRARRTSVDFLFALRADGREAVLPFFEGRHRNFHFHQALPGLSEFGYQFDLDGADDLHAVATFRPSGHACDAEIMLVNRTAADRTVELELLAVIPPELQRPPELRLRAGEEWVGAENYAHLTTWAARSEDGYRNLVKADVDAVGGVSVTRSWALLPGTSITYRVDLKTALPHARMGIRFHKNGREALPYTLDWDGRSQELVFPVADRYQWLWLELGDVRPGPHEFSIRVDPRSRITVPRDLYGQVPGNIRLDGFLVGAAARAEAVITPDAETPPVVQRAAGCPGEFACCVDLSPVAYAVGFPATAEQLQTPRLFAGEEFTQHVGRAFPLGSWRLPGVQVPAHGTRTLNLRFAHGADMPAALAALGAFTSAASVPATAPLVAPQLETGFRTLAASCLMNVSYPVFLPWEVIASYTPGKTFGGLYSWDAGMHGLGLLEVDPAAAIECLNVYLCGTDDPVDFIWHGTPLPVQAYLLNEILQRTGDRELLAYFYPRARRFYQYLAGHTPGSPTNRFGNGLLNTYPIFYNSGGWDDLPPQFAVHTRGLEDEITPVCSTAHAVRFARFLMRFAERLGHAADVPGYQADIARGVQAIERTWDPAAQVYSYVHHRTFQPFRHEGGANFNFTLDAMTPLIGGGIRAECAQMLWSQLRSPERYATPAGISTVDRTAPYYQADGYWNGCVWIPHQWFLWKAALDWGQGDLARDIPRRVADVWEREVRRTRCTFEFFRISTGAGDGYPHFAGLSSPALAMMAAISKPGRVTVGFDAEVRQVQREGNHLSFQTRTDNPGQSAVALAVMPAPGRYRVASAAGTTWCETDDLGAVAFPLPSSRTWTVVQLMPAAQVPS